MAKGVVTFLSIFLLNGDLSASSKAEECFSFIQEQLDSASKQLEEVTKREGLIKISDKRVYIKILKEGAGSDTVSDSDSPTVILKVYELKPEEDETPYIIDKPIRMELPHCISGLQAGMKGMKVGEVRRIYVHPTFMQGFFGPYSVYGAAYYYDIEIVSLNRPN